MCFDADSYMTGSKKKGRRYSVSLLSSQAQIKGHSTSNQLANATQVQPEMYTSASNVRTSWIKQYCYPFS